MTQPPPIPTPALEYGPPPRGANGWAVASLVCGLILCVPLLTGVAAAITGVLGLRRSREVGGRGRGLAIAGLILAGANVLLWAAIAAGGLVVYRNSVPVRATARQFALDLAAGNTAAAGAKAPSLTPAALKAAAGYLKPFGTPTAVSFTSVRANSVNGVTDWTLAGTLTYPTRTVTYTARLRAAGAGYVVVGFTFK